MKRLILSIAVPLTILAAAGCGKPQPDQMSSGDAVTASVAASETGTTEKKFQPFVIYKNKGTRDNHFVPSGFMPNGKCMTFEDTWKENCHDGSSCIKIVYDVACSREDQKWVGIYWLNPANNWGSRKGGFDLTGAERLTFWARGEKGGERIEEFKMGGITGDYPDTDTAVIGPVILTNEWQQYTIDLRGKDLTYVSGGFGWSTNVDVNPENCVFYLDEIQYE
ncbi:MAG: hypothetical protein Q8Q08_06540 [Candidatus Omnitrophota bacterium]|nr:hypothetical protein [Candidatus Omnitrophota bacterium]MDZ4243269.1 hypothetical protein [Candidatus Omnitrophota bacterium]